MISGGTGPGFGFKLLPSVFRLFCCSGSTENLKSWCQELNPGLFILFFILEIYLCLFLLVIFDFQIPFFFQRGWLLPFWGCFLPSVIHSAHNENHILLSNTCSMGSQVQMDQQGGITCKPNVPWFSPDANRIQSSVNTVVLQSLEGWFHPTSCVFRARKLLLSGILHQVKPNAGSWPRRTVECWAPGCDRTPDCVFCSSSQLSAEH